MNPAEAHRLVGALSAAGFLLLALEVYFSNMAIFGALALAGATGLACCTLGIDAGSLLLLAISTVSSLGFLFTLVYLPKSPLATRFLRRAAEKAAAEEEKDAEE